MSGVLSATPGVPGPDGKARARPIVDRANLASCGPSSSRTDCDGRRVVLAAEEGMRLGADDIGFVYCAADDVGPVDPSAVHHDPGRVVLVVDQRL